MSDEEKGGTYETRKEAFRDAKRQNEIPVSKQPQKEIKPNTVDAEEYKLDDRNIRLYVYASDTQEEDESHLIREDYPVDYDDNESNQMQHFNVGKKKDKKLKQHFYFFRRNK